MPRYNIEIEAVIDADNEQHADALATLITGMAEAKYGPFAGPPAGINAVVARCDVAVVIEKTPTEAL